jgi:hypothetical protein
LYKQFNYKAQLPTSYFLIENNNTINDDRNKIINIYDKFEKTYIEYELLKNYPIPIYGITIINKLLKYIKIEKISSLKYYKTNTISKKTILSDISSSNFKYENIKTCLLSNLIPKLVINYSDSPEQYFNTTKLVLAHKMYGFPYMDISGECGISSRDNYIFLEQDYNISNLVDIQKYLSTKFALFIFSTTNYRMRYLERYAFQFIPDISKITDFSINNSFTRLERDKYIYNFFNFTEKEREIIEDFSREYKFFI